jgi:hypothetical protein
LSGGTEENKNLRDLNLGPQEYEAGVSTIHLLRSVKDNIKIDLAVTAPGLIDTHGKYRAEEVPKRVENGTPTHLCSLIVLG